MNKQILRNVVFTGLFLVPFIPFLVSSSLFFPFITTKAFAWRIIVEFVFAAWVLLALLDAEYRPKRSLILYSVFIFLGIVGLADLFGAAPVKSFWSNFERMEGYITLLHLGMFFIVISSVFREIDWKRWWNTSLAASFIMVLYSVLQIVGLKTINQGGVRVDGTLGNAIYLAAYMLFHMFIALLFLWREWKNVILRWVYGILIVAQAFVLYYTATRGAILGLLGGLFVAAVLNLRNKEDAVIKKASTVVLVALVIVVGGFISIRNTNFVQENPVLVRFATITTTELQRGGRAFVWPMAFEGFKERPFLGWGQENFSYVFQKYYSPEMFRLEPWFDRAHNIFLDWLVVGGILGLASYLLLYGVLLYLIWKRDENLSHAEKSVLTGLIAAYFFHNFFVFDHLISYILFFSLLAYVHSRSQGEMLLATFHPALVKIALPAVGILLALSLYFVNVKPLMGNIFLIEALKSVQIPGRMPDALQYFQKSYNISRLGRPEVTEHLAARAVPIFSSDVSIEEKNAFFVFAKDAVVKQTENLKDDARSELIAGSFLSTTGQLDEALTHLERARELMPGKQQIYYEIANVYINAGNDQEAINVLNYVSEISPDHKEQNDVFIQQIRTGEI
ncbi:MAG: O-antigen ligase family protein [Candidatus Zambryskibacteria bacterium]|nr:O-antigen ligase family protein [Candidatus Zambryskibacteria bacterium]